MTWLEQIPNRLIAPARNDGLRGKRVLELERWCTEHSKPRPTLLQLETERVRRGMR